MTPALLAVLAASLSYAGPAARVQSVMGSGLGALGVSAEQAEGVWRNPPAVVSREDVGTDDPRDPDSPLNADNAPYSFRKDGAETVCKTVLGKVRWKYCVTATQGSASRTVLYFLHGHGDNAEDWIKSGDYKRKIRQDWKTAGVPAPIVVSVSFGGFWVLVDKNQSSRSGLLPFFKDEVMPVVEKDLGFTDAAPRRLLMGQSMGGLNAAQLVMKYPRLFARAVLAFPALAHLSPYAGQADLDAYKAQPGVSGFKVWMMTRLARKVFKNQADYLKSDPFTLGRTELSAATPPLLVSVGDRDSFGFYKSVGEFVDLAKSKGVDVSYDVIAGGGHKSADPDHIASFLAR